MNALTIESLEDGFAVVAAMIRIEHGPDCPELGEWRRRAAVLDRAATGDGAARAEAQAIVRAWGRPAEVSA
ncbi:hypothetical protein ACFY4C_20470 [Actinomadura viridis]|uniref:hypothetical protein n=1 Tax=Actinomadura viridis TaxID=58110 RepID=UPI0036861E19